jgi:hypothetical protein
MRAMKRALFALLALVLLWFVVRAIVHAFASDERKIRWVVEDMADGFNETRMNPIMSGLAEDFLEDSWGADKALARAGLAQMFLQSKEALTKKFPYRVEIPEEEFHVQVHDGEPRTAEFDLLAKFDESKAGEWSARWQTKVHAQLVLGPGGWKIRSARMNDGQGQRLR